MARREPAKSYGCFWRRSSLSSFFLAKPEGIVHPMIVGNWQDRHNASNDGEMFMDLIQKIKSMLLGSATSLTSDASDELAYKSPMSLRRVKKRSDLLEVEDGAVWLETPTDRRTFRRPPPVFHDDPDGAGLFGDFPDTVVTYPAPFVVGLKDAKQIGYRSYISKGGVFFNDQVYIDDAGVEENLSRLRQSDAFPNEDTGLVEGSSARHFKQGPMVRSVEILSEEIISLCSLEPSNYGSFLFRILPKLGTVGDLLGTRRVLVPIFSPSMRELLHLCGIPDERIIAHDTHVTYQISRVLVPSNRNIHAFIDDETRTFFARLRNRYSDGKREKKIFVSRLGWSGSYAATHRVMVNEKEVAAALQKLGFELVLTHQMSVLEQISMFASASFIVGASGSAMFNVVFSHPGTKLIDIESEPHWIFAHTNLFASFELDYGVFEARRLDPGDSTPHKPFSVNVDALVARVKSML